MRKNLQYSIYVEEVVAEIQAKCNLLFVDVQKMHR